ncbi:MAG: chemotaxis protein CheW, partial [Verrucomicrobia bacterium]|nr:chemotaxis protein CheW [Verrucomicrobiota bacterium]
MSAVVTLGLVRIGAVDLAIPGDFIEEVVRGPIAVSPFPHAPQHVLGAFALRGRPIPTIDLAALVARAGVPPDRPVAYAMVLRHPTGRCAIQVDEVLGVTKASADQITDLETRLDGGLFSRVFTPATGGRVAAVLDLDAMLATEGVRSAALASERAADRDAAEAATRPLVLFRVGGACLGIEAAHVREVQPRPVAL